MSKPLVSIIILAYNNLEYTRLCLESIYAKTEVPTFETIIVDNASSDGTPEFLGEFVEIHHNARAILNSTNEGFSRGNNIGAAAATGEHLVFLNNDTVVTRGWLTRLIHHLQDPTVGMVGPVTNSSGNETRIRVDYDGLEEMDVFAEEYTLAHKGQVFEIRMLPFMCVALRRMVFEEIGPLDERFGVGMFEDDDYALRLKEKGYKLLCAEDVFIHHWGSAGFSLSGFAQYWQLYQENLNKFETKWGKKWQPHRYRDSLLDEQIAQLWEEKRWLSFEVIGLREQLDDIQSSAGWKLFQELRAVRVRIAPNDSTRSRLIGYCINGLSYALRKGKNIYPAFSLRRHQWRKFWRDIHLRRKLKRELNDILVKHANAKETIIFVPTVFWNTPLFQRPQQLALAFARQGCLVFFCEPPESRDYQGVFYPFDENLYVLGSAPLDIFRQVSSPIVFTLAYNKAYLRNFSYPRVVYEYIDELDVFYGDPEEIQENHDDLVKTADLVIATADNLFKRLKNIRDDTLMCPNAVDYDFIQNSIRETEEPPEDLIKIVQAGKPIIGYYGALARWFDYKLLSHVASKRANYQFVLIGPDYDASIKKSRIIENNNVYWLGPKPYLELPGYLKYFDVATIPFILSELTHSTSPLKLFEYMTARKPIITTAMHECEKYPGVLVAQDETDFIEKLDNALDLREDSQYLQLLDRVARENTWDIRAKTMLNALAYQKVEKTNT